MTRAPSKSSFLRKNSPPAIKWHRLYHPQGSHALSWADDMTSKYFLHVHVLLALGYRILSLRPPRRKRDAVQRENFADLVVAYSVESSLIDLISVGPFTASWFGVNNDVAHCTHESMPQQKSLVTLGAQCCTWSKLTGHQKVMCHVLCGVHSRVCI